MLEAILIIIMITAATLSANQEPVAPKVVSIPPGLALDKTLHEEIRKELWPNISRFYWKSRGFYLAPVMNKGVTDINDFEWRFAEYRAFQDTHWFIESVAGPDYNEMVRRQTERHIDTSDLLIAESELDKMLNLQSRIEYALVFGLPASEQEMRERAAFIKSAVLFRFFDRVYVGNPAGATLAKVNLTFLFMPRPIDTK